MRTTGSWAAFAAAERCGVSEPQFSWIVLSCFVITLSYYIEYLNSSLRSSVLMFVSGAFIVKGKTEGEESFYRSVDENKSGCRLVQTTQHRVVVLLIK